MSEQSPEAARSFEEAFGDLQKVVEHLERGELSLEQSLEAYARGTVLLKDCYGILDDARIRRYFELGCEVKGLGRGQIQRIKKSVGA